MSEHRPEKTILPGLPGAVLARLWRRDEGAMAVLAVFVFVAMLLVGGLAIDLMRHENERIRMQSTADRAVLAATMMRANSANATPQQIIDSYFAAEGLTAQLGGRVIVDEDPETGRTVTVVPAASVPSLFMRLVGVDSFDVVTPARATEAVAGGAQIEIVMVLDVSGSMSWQQKIETMRTAAATLASSLLADADPGDVAITMVPYDANVLPPSGFLNSFTNVTGSGACNDWSVWNSIADSISLPTFRVNCSTDAWRTVRPYLSDATTATTYINNLRAAGTTSIDLGVRWGALFFDPSMRPAITQMITNGEISNVFAGRPYDWHAPNVVRAMIVLTDGENCCGARYSLSQQNLNTLSICTELKNHGVLIYSVAFQAPTGGAALMQACASSPSHYFNASTAEILSVFEGIGGSIQTQALRLTL